VRCTVSVFVSYWGLNHRISQGLDSRIENDNPNVTYSEYYPKMGIPTASGSSVTPLSCVHCYLAASKRTLRNLGLTQISHSTVHI
jgi:hypothetical protein